MHLRVYAGSGGSSALQIFLLGVLLPSLGLLCTAQVNPISYKHKNMLEIDVNREIFISLDKSLWSYLNKTGASRNALLKKVYDTYRTQMDPLLPDTDVFNTPKYSVLKHYEWSELQRDLMEIDGIYGFFKRFIKHNPKAETLEERAVLDICETVLGNQTKFSMLKTLENIELFMVKQALYYRALLESKEEICRTQQSPQQFVYSLYVDIALTELKGYSMMEFSWMMLRIYGKGNFTQEAELMRSDYERRTERTLRLLREIMRRSDRILWRCDPENYIPGVTYDEVTRLLQGYVENEVDLNNEETCRETCPFYESTTSQGCFKEKFCARQSRCSGRIYNCDYVDSDMWICQAPRNSTRRYEYIEYENGIMYGKKGTCSRGTTEVESWWRYVLWHCSYCFCLCDEQSQKSDRFFNLRETLSDVANNKVVTGLRFVKHKRVFHLQIQEGQLLPRGAINASSLSWRKVDDYNIFDSDVENNRDYHTLTYESRSIDLDDIETDLSAFVVTGLRFRMIGAHLNLEARMAEFDFESGKLKDHDLNSFWKSNDNTDVSGEPRKKVPLRTPDAPQYSIVKSLPDSRHNQFIDFTHSDKRKDAAQSTVPFIDIQDVVSNPPVPLSGIGLYHKGRDGYGGFIAPKIITYDFTPHVHVADYYKP